MYDLTPKLWTANEIQSRAMGFNNGPVQIAIFPICRHNASKDVQGSIYRIESILMHLMHKNLFQNTIKAMLEKPLLGEPEGNCHSIALAFMTDLIIAREAQGWRMMEACNRQVLTPDKPWEHSWLEYNGFAVDATNKLGPDNPAITIEEVGQYYKRRYIGKIVKNMNARQTVRFIDRLLLRAKDKKN